MRLAMLAAALIIIGELSDRIEALADRIGDLERPEGVSAP